MTSGGDEDHGWADPVAVRWRCPSWLRPGPVVEWLWGACPSAPPTCAWGPRWREIRDGMKKVQAAGATTTPPPTVSCRLVERVNRAW